MTCLTASVAESSWSFMLRRGPGPHLRQGGHDELVGGTQNDRLRGRSGDDALFGENGKHDRLFGGSGFDTADGGMGTADVCDADNEAGCEL